VREKTHAINDAIASNNFAEAMNLRGRGFKESFQILRTLVRALPHEPKPGQRRLRLAVLTMPAACARYEHGGARGGAAGAGSRPLCLASQQFHGLINDDMRPFEFEWMERGTAGRDGRVGAGHQPAHPGAKRLLCHRAHHRGT
jgi:6-phosphofructokinase 1